MKKFFCVIFVCLFMNSCSRLDLAVQFASTYVANKADDYFDTTKEQTKWIKANFEKDFKRIQKTIFPQLAAELNKAAAVIAEKRQLDVDEVSVAYDRVKNLAYDSMRIFAANTTLFVDTLSPQQISYFQKEFDKKLKDLKDDDSSKETYKKTKKQFDSWMGNMSSEQKRDLEDFTKANPPLTDEKIANRRAIAQEFVTSYQDKNKRKAFMQKFMTKFDVMYEGRFSKASHERNQKMIAVVTTILNKMSNDQRETLITTLKDRANQLIKISKN